ncbi:APH domain-containing protein [Mycena indigotica]|uniref:APH domain-containing protein n=1 Tax=Mycena indigotica TaxID=2126181 RepID=A0A8H6VWU7_9AGAR|nr:APH domain-containing protein [Mycena indigotica]KAF7293073.1 APH domain-containing protein [Mycena indigotica]
MSSSSTDLDLSIASNVITYLSGTPFSSYQADILPGGNANFTFRLFLDNPSPMISGGMKTVVLKHAKGWSKSSPSFTLKIERQAIEAFALQRVRQILDDSENAGSSLVTVPRVLLHDPVAHVIIMEDAGENSEPLKALLRRTSLPSGNLARLCHDLGHFLADIHNRGSKDPELMEKVGSNEEMRSITSWITYDRVVPILRGEKEYSGLLSPSLLGADGLSEQDMARIGQLCSQRAAEIRAAVEVFTMGDFWTGNIICRRDAASGAVEKAFVVDWEVTKPGIPFLDFGQLAAELYTIGCFHPEREEELRDALKAYGKAYAKSRETSVDELFVRGAGSHLGAHLAVITPTVEGWGTREQVREVVKQGTEFILKGIEGDMVWLQDSVVGGLM